MGEVGIIKEMFIQILGIKLPITYMKLLAIMVNTFIHSKRLSTRMATTMPITEVP
ncbi:unnamed protein product, partial [Dovyalis caffra]